MQCIFCKEESSSSRSVEHIIPESLGNKEHVLPSGVVCDRCNRYFSVKIEKKLLEMPEYTNLRFQHSIESKKGRCPIEKAVLLNSLDEPLGGVELHKTKEGKLEIVALDEHVAEKFKTIGSGALVYPAYDLPDENDRIISRFLGKVGLEILAFKLLNSSISDRDKLLLLNSEIVYKKELDDLRNYVRYDTPRNLIWPYNLRRIYGADKLFKDSNNNEYQVLHEFDLLYTNNQELFVILAIMGVEYCLNIGGPYIESYLKWLKDNNFKSPLYMDGVPD